MATTPLDLVIRPPGTWDTRAPFNPFYKEHRAHNRLYALTTLGLEMLEGVAKRYNEKDLSNSRFKKEQVLTPLAGLAFGMYRRSYDAKLRQRGHPTPTDLANDVIRGEVELRQQILVSYLSAFDSFAICFALNYLLALLESGKGWTADQRTFVENRLHPVMFQKDGTWKLKKVHNLPSANSVLCDKGLDLEKELRKQPHTWTDPSTGEDLVEPVSSDVNAWEALEFWRKFRNQVVHRDAQADVRGPWRDRWNDLMGQQGLAGHLQLGAMLPGAHRQVTACFASHYATATWLREELCNVSGNQRGHILAPGPPRQPGQNVSDDERGKPLLINGDHVHSLAWHNAHGLS